MDLRDQLDRAINAMGRMSLLATLAQKVREARDTDARLCGNCQSWMKSRECPREHNVNGYKRGPSMNDAGCGQFTLQPHIWQLKLQRLRDAVAFAKEHSLPVPTEELHLHLEPRP